MPRRPAPRFVSPLAFGAPLAAALLLAGCNSSGEPQEAPTPTPSLTTRAAPTASAEGEPLTPGRWTIEESAGGASAAYGEAQGAPVLLMVCNANTGIVTLSRPGSAQEPQTFTLEAAGQRAAVRMSPAGEAPLTMRAEIDPTQPIFAAFADPAASIEISAAGATALRLPGHSGIARVIEACR